jgi:hypothetical protein
MCNQRDFRRFAELCIRLAEDDGFVGRRDALEQMGLVFRQLAAEEARLEALIRDIDTFFAEPADACPQPPPWTPSRLH